MLVASLAAGGAFRGGLLGRNTLALESTSMKYLQPVRPGDRIYCDVTVASADPAAGKRFGRLVWHTEVFRVLAGRPSQLAVTVDWTLLVFKRAFLPEDEPLAAGSAPAPVTMAEPARRGLRQPLRRLRRA
jgi:acyl dehydratase